MSKLKLSHRNVQHARMPSSHIRSKHELSRARLYLPNRRLRRLNSRMTSCRSSWDTSGQSLSRKTSSAYAIWNSMKLLMRSSPDVRMSKSGSGSPLHNTQTQWCVCVSNGNRGVPPSKRNVRSKQALAHKSLVNILDRRFAARHLRGDALASADDFVPSTVADVQTAESAVKSR